jgi:hypothetical protein
MVGFTRAAGAAGLAGEAGFPAGGLDLSDCSRRDWLSVSRSSSCRRSSASAPRSSSDHSKRVFHSAEKRDLPASPAPAMLAAEWRPEADVTSPISTTTL